MSELFKTVLILSLLGFGLTALLLCLKPITVKKFPAKWQYYIWITVLLSMIAPVYKLIPKKLPFIPQSIAVQQEAPYKAPESLETTIIEETPVEYREVNLTPKLQIRLPELFAYIWFSGCCVFLLTVITSYAVYLRRKRKNAVVLDNNAVFDKVKKELNIKRHIKIRMSSEVNSPMLVGVFFPVIYIPCKDIPDKNMRMVFLHELIHYKRKDLLIKWLSVFANAVHWFNPLVYLLCSNISEACEVSCDMAVIKNMSDTEQKIYMKTILELAEEKE